MSTDQTAHRSRPGARGFRQAASLLQKQVRAAGEQRGFAVSRLLTQWAEIAGQDIAAMAHPVKVAYGRDGLGATLTLLCAGAVAPMVQMRLPQLRDRVNACYGYNAISRIRITQTAPQGFAESQTGFEGPAPVPAARPEPSAAVAARADAATGTVADAGLRDALHVLARNILIRQEQKERSR